MKQLNLKAQIKRTFKKSKTVSIDDPRIASNRLNRHFNVSYPNQTWVADITEIKLKDGQKGYLAAFMDLYSRRIVGWEFESHIRSELVELALQRALWNRKPPRGLMVHTDQGSQFVSSAYKQLLKEWGIQASMSRRDNCWDNAVIERFFKTLKTEEIYQLPRRLNLIEMRSTIAAFITHYNEIRPHSSNDGLSPDQKEQKRKEEIAKLDTKNC